MGSGGLRTMEQSIAAGNDFNGAAPTTDKAIANGIEKFPEDTVGGLFDFELDAPVSVRSVELFLTGTQKSWSIHKRDVEGRELLVVAGEKEEFFLTTEADSFVLTDKQFLVVRTDSSTGAMFARVSVQAVR